MILWKRIRGKEWFAMEQHKDNLDGKCAAATDDSRWPKGSGKKLLTALLLSAVFLAGCDGRNSGKNGGGEAALSSEMHIESIGGVYASPVATGDDYQASAGTDAVSLYAEREGLEPGTGVLTLYDDADDHVLAEIPADSGQVAFGPVAEEQKAFYGMDGGTEIRVSLGFGLEAGKRYYVEVSEDFARFEDVRSRAFGGKGQWPIQIEE